MKKKLAAIILSCALAVSMLTACSDEAETSDNVVNAEDVGVEKVEDETGKMEKAASMAGIPQSELNQTLDDEDFAAFQDLYSEALDAYNIMVDMYNTGKISQSRENGEYLDDCYEFLILLGEVEHGDLTYGDAIEFTEDLNAMVDGFNSMIE